VTGKDVYVDPSALVRLFIHQPGSKEMSDWRRKVDGPLYVTHHGRTEIINAIGLAAFRGVTALEDANIAWQELEQEFIDDGFRQADLLWRAALNRAGELSRIHSARIGTRSLDVLHVSCALELNMKFFLSFDERQLALAEAVGLRRVAV
jgi:predicted nucleic acid-binding protein